MSHGKYNKPLLFISLIFTIAILCPTSWAAKSDSVPILYLAAVDSNCTEKFTIDANYSAADKPNLVIATHGWFEKEPWPAGPVLAIKDKVDSKTWLCGWYDWRSQAKVINPIDAAKYARDTAGPMLGEKITKLSGNFKHIHLIGHSAGSWVISEAAKIVNKKTNAAIHLTFLDAYVPPFWNESELGNLKNDPNITNWADHYLTRDITLGATEKTLTNAHNVDLTDITPGINDHKFPHYWYNATVIGRYAAKGRYEGKELFYRSGNLEYGFARGLEAGPKNWEKSTKLKTANVPVKLKRPQKPFKLKLKELFKK